MYMVYMAVGTGGALGAIALPFPQKKKKSLKLNYPINTICLYMIHCKCNFCF